MKEKFHNSRYLLIFVIVWTFYVKVDLYSQINPKIDIIVIDAGHGGKDPGTTSARGTYEKDINLKIVKILKEYLEKDYSDIKIVLTRDKDEFIELKERGKLANESGGKLFLSIHCNAKKTEENDKSGFEIYIPGLERLHEAMEITFTENENIDFIIPQDTSGFYVNKIITSLAQSSYLRYSERFASILETEMIKTTRIQSRGLMQAGFWVLVGASMPCVLVECGYLSNKIDEEYLTSTRGQENIARALFKSIRYLKMDYEFEN